MAGREIQILKPNLHLPFLLYSAFTSSLSYLGREIQIFPTLFAQLCSYFILDTPQIMHTSNLRKSRSIPVHLTVAGEEESSALPFRDQLYKIGLPGKSILRDHFRENRTFRRLFLLLRISFPGRPISIQLPPGAATARAAGTTCVRT